MARPQVPYQIIREYRLSGAKDSKADSQVVAEVNFKPPSSEGYTIERYSGSGRGQQLVRSVLDHEIEVSSKNNKDRSAISRNNYTFTYIGEACSTGNSCYVLGLKPKRTDKDLISGQVWVDKHSFLIRQIQGDVEKTPSWWLKKVRITLVFADLEGTWVQKSMEAVAEVRLVGTHTLTSRILDYRKESQVAASPVAGTGVSKIVATKREEWNRELCFSSGKRGRDVPATAGRCRRYSFSRMNYSSARLQNRIRYAGCIYCRLDIVSSQNVRAFENQRGLRRKRSVKSALGRNILSAFLPSVRPINDFREVPASSGNPAACSSSKRASSG